MQSVDIVVIGGGIVGLATAYQLGKREPALRVGVVEKEAAVAQHQSGRNSGVLHSGIYYKPGSLKAENCREGRRAMIDFCAAEGLPHSICGKVIVATRDSEVIALEHLYDRALANGVDARVIDAVELADLEPHAAGLRAIHLPEAGVADFRAVCERLVERIREQGSLVVTRAEVLGITSRRDRMVVHTRQGDFEGRDVANCAGLYSDRVAAMTGERPEARIVPFRGEYFALRESASHLVRHLIYPVPDPRFPFLGVHFTRLVDGKVECGPNAVAALGREAYGKVEVTPRDLFESITYRGFLRFAARHARVGAGEVWRSMNKGAFVSALQRLVPQVGSQDLIPARAGIRAQAMLPDGTLVDDFLISETRLAMHVLNAPSPAATSAFNIGRTLAERIEERLADC
ncbi:MAG: L-2-hydroxyglutarate oxidase [Polyangiaceae bacterium]|nr:L-2-hydroxyglutarate oxidase [Polyangiaceae bacterium]